MCGIVGFWGPAKDHIPTSILGMTTRLEHRGPDDSGIWFDLEEGVAIGHRRLSIVDLSVAGHQPFVSKCGRFILSFNGEIYNHAELRATLTHSLDNPQWNGHSDTETLMGCLAAWGAEETLNRLNGMFAFALWDRQEKTLLLARDRLGEKPLYYGWTGGSLLFGSELKALAAHPSWRGKIDKGAVFEYLRYGYIPDPLSIYCGIKKLPAGHWVLLRSHAEQQSPSIPYWELEEVASEGLAERDIRDSSVVAGILEQAIDSAVHARLMADVPVGIFLSGGYDSVAIAAAAQAQSANPIDTFTIGLSGSPQDEAMHAREIAAYIGSRHHEHYVTPSEVTDTIPDLAGVYDEPFGDTSQIPTLLLSRFASSHTKVVLSGDGGDELFEGYTHYSRARLIRRLERQIPSWLRRRLVSIMTTADAMPKKSSTLRALLEKIPGGHRAVDRLGKIAPLLLTVSTTELYYALVCHLRNPNLVLNEAGLETALPSLALDGIDGMRLQDGQQYLPGDILTKVDRATMACGLECRAPLLDPAVVAFAWRLPETLTHQGGVGKWILRETVHRRVPRQIMQRPKTGFSLPIDQWLRGPLRDWAESLLDQNQLKEGGILDPVATRHLWQQHLTGKLRAHHAIWDILMLQAWLTNKLS